MESPIFLEAEERERLAWVVESALQVQTQPGFFLWSQGPLQWFLPHEILVAMVCAGHGRTLKSVWFASTRYFREEHFADAVRAEGGFLHGLMTRWGACSQPLFLELDKVDDDTEATLLDLELRSVVAQGVRGADGSVAGFFAFGRTPIKESGKSSRLMQAVVPYVHFTLCRVLAHELAQAGSAQRSDILVTAREVEILRWIREGKTTSDIAEILRLSPFTVKNHVQNILKKLGAKSRSHAVAQAISMGILPVAGFAI